MLQTSDPRAPENIDDFVPLTREDGSPFTEEDYDAMLEDDENEKEDHYPAESIN